jgi:hypothetical protein
MSDRDTITLFGAEYRLVPRFDGKPGYITARRLPKLAAELMEQWQQDLATDVMAKHRLPRAVLPALDEPS